MMHWPRLFRVVRLLLSTHRHGKDPGSLIIAGRFVLGHNPIISMLLHSGMTLIQNQMINPVEAHVIGPFIKQIEEDLGRGYNHTVLSKHFLPLHWNVQAIHRQSNTSISNAIMGLDHCVILITS